MSAVLVFISKGAACSSQLVQDLTVVTFRIAPPPCRWSVSQYDIAVF